MGPIPSVLVFLFQCKSNACETTVKPLDLHVLLGKIRQCIYMLCKSMFNNKMALSFNINIYTGYMYTAKKVSCRQENMFLVQESFYLQGIFSYINERDTFFLDCKHKHMLQKTELHLTNLVPCTVCYIWNYILLTVETVVSRLSHFVSWY